MRPIIHNDISGFVISEDLVNRYDTYVPEPGPQPEPATANEVQFAHKSFGQRIKNFFGIGVSHRPAGVRNRYQRNY